MFEERDNAMSGGTWVDLEKRLKAAPDSLDWVTEGKTLKPLEQGDCASCWAMATISAVEGRYAIVTGKLKRFSVQELVDCTYEYTGSDTGCSGGWFTKSYKYMKTGGHLTLDADLPYNAKDGTCTSASLPNGFKAASLTAWKQEKNPTFDQMVVAIQDGPVSVGVKAQDDFFQYGTGIYYNPTCSTDLNHGLVGVGYSPSYIVLRNSWGYDWGQGGYVYFTRTHGNVCGLTSYMVWGTLTPNGGTDDDPAAIPESANGVCRDQEPEQCGEYGLIGCSDPMTSNFMKTNCRFTCKICTVPTGDDDCPPGEIKCGAECKAPSICQHSG
ncbi:uncharacterized protein LOC134813228 [Bolinopsis microptera]|uniref:uncharacterized protein LOC134813228 n=1 Tax=Bolinopsis microptera TaxID=2820187 RepID=UPI00307A36C7